MGLGAGAAGGGQDDGGPRPAVATVTLREVPVRVFLRLGHHVDELSRELEILGVSGDRRSSPGAAALRLPFQRLLDRCEEQRRSAMERAEAAADDGAERFHLALTLPAGATEVVRELASVLERADELSRRDELLTMAAPKEVALLRQWIVEEVEAQLAGGEPPGRCPV